MSKTNIIFIIAVLLLSQINMVYAESFEWTQTTQADFDAGKKANVNTSSSPGDVLLGLGIDFNRPTISAGWSHTVGLKENGTVVAVGWNQQGQLNVSNWSDIKAVAAGGWHTVGLKEDGTVVVAGNNYCGELNVANWISIKAIDAGECHTVGLKEDGTVVAVGDDRYGQLNVSDWRNIKGVAAGDWHTFGLKEDDTVVAVGRNDYGQLDVYGWRGIKAIATSWSHIVGLKEDGTVVAVGYNGVGQLNIANWSNIRQPSYINYSSGGTLTSSVFDTQKGSNFTTIAWNATVTREVGIKAIKFQIATNSDNSTWNFVGPDGKTSTYYTTSGQSIWQGHNGSRYIRYKLYLSTDTYNFTPTLHDVTINYRSGSV